jgi:hypothetical protein
MQIEKYGFYVQIFLYKISVNYHAITRLFPRTEVPVPNLGRKKFRWSRFFCHNDQEPSVAFGRWCAVQEPFDTTVSRYTAQIARRGRIENARSSPFHKFAVGEPTETIAEWAKF